MNLAAKVAVIHATYNNVGCGDPNGSDKILEVTCPECLSLIRDRNKPLHGPQTKKKEKNIAEYFMPWGGNIKI